MTAFPTPALRRALTGADDTPLVFLGNFEVEREWARGEVALPRLSSAESTAIVNRMDEFALLLGDGRDRVVVKSQPDPDWLEHLGELGFELPVVEVVGDQRPERSVSGDALADAALLASLSALQAGGHQLAPHGVSELEEDLAAVTGLPLAAPSATVCKNVNSKVYSRRLADDRGIRQPQGWACSSVTEWLAAVEEAACLLPGSRLVVKEAFGVSGTGMALVDTERRLRRLAGIVAAQGERNGGRLAFSIERWVDKAVDLNYQVTVPRSGAAALDFVKEAVTEAGVHRGHRWPTRLPAEHLHIIRETADQVASALASAGYFGVVGVDALVERNGTLHPLIEINARNNMSTYQVPVQAQVGADCAEGVLSAHHYPLRLQRPVGYGSVRRALGELLWAPGRRSGLIVHNFATVNAAIAMQERRPGQDVAGRLYAVLVAPDEKGIAALDGAVLRALDTVERQAA